MKLQGDYVFDAPVDEVWKALLDPIVLAAVMPGCEKLDLVDGTYVGDLNIKVGPVQGKFSGKVDLKDIVEPKSYTMNVDGRGAPGFVKATASVKLEAEGDKTKMTYDADAQVGGKIASVGQRLLEASSRAITKQSLEGLNENIKIRVAASKAHAEALAEAAKADAKVEPKIEAPKAVEEPATAAATADPSEVETEPSPKVRAKAAEPKPAPPAPPPVVLKRVDQNALAAGIAKEVSKSLLPSTPVIVIGLGVVALVIWLVVR
jgi:carbon monoxide dehydrogenase subunit G